MSAEKKNAIVVKASLVLVNAIFKQAAKGLASRSSKGYVLHIGGQCGLLLHLSVASFRTQSRHTKSC